VAELVDRSDSAQDVAFAGIFEELHEADRSVPVSGKLPERERSRPGLGGNKPDREPEREPDGDPDHEREPVPAAEPGSELEGKSQRKPDHEPAHEPDDESEDPVAAPGSERGQRTRARFMTTESPTDRGRKLRSYLA